MTVSQPKKTTLVVADDHTIVRRGLIQIISNDPELIVLGEAEDGAEALKLIEELDVDVLVMDIGMPGKSGIDIIFEAKTIKPDLNILMLSVFPEEHYAIRCIKAGASGYLNKTCAPDDLVTAIKKISRTGEKYISPGLAEKLILNREQAQINSSHEILTDREFQIFCKLASGKSPKEIGQELSISAATVCTHRSHILNKMDLKNNAEMTLYARKHHLIQDIA